MKMKADLTLRTTRVLNNGTSIPVLGFGTAGIADGQPTIDVVRHALGAGYRHIDAASKYGNESGVGKGLRESGIPREEIFLTSKIWNSDIRAHRELDAFEDSLRRLDTDYIDLYLLHWPVAGEYLRSWKELEKLYRDGRVRAIGVCNCQPHHLDAIRRFESVMPVVNQVECHPHLSQNPLQAYCDDQEIALVCHSPLGGSGIGSLTGDTVLSEIGSPYGKSAAQVILRWHLQQGRIPIPKSVHMDRIRANVDLFDFELTGEDIDRIDELNRNQRSGGNPDTFTF